MTSIRDIAPLIGHTPLLSIDYVLDSLHVFDAAYCSGDLHLGDKIVEASSGNTGISLSAIGRALGHNVRIYMPSWMSDERTKLIQSMGSEIIPVSRSQGGFVECIALSRLYAEEHDNVFLPKQFENSANIDAHYKSTGPEIKSQLDRHGLLVDAFVAGVGTGGTVMGVGRYLRHNGLNVRVHPLEPANSPTLRTGSKAGTHRIQGISDEFVPNIINLDELDDIVDIWDGDAIIMAQMLCDNLGLAVGISSGANFLGAVKIAQQMGPEAVVVTVFPDSNKKYLSTDLLQSEPRLEHYLSPEIKLSCFRSVC